MLELNYLSIFQLVRTSIMASQLILDLWGTGSKQPIPLPGYIFPFCVDDNLSSCIVSAPSHHLSETLDNAFHVKTNTVASLISYDPNDSNTY